MKKISLVLALIFALALVLPGCDGGDATLPYAGPIDGGDQPADGGGDGVPDDGDGIQPPPPPVNGGDEGDLQPPDPPVF